MRTAMLLSKPVDSLDTRDGIPDVLYPLFGPVHQCNVGGHVALPPSYIPLPCISGVTFLPYKQDANRRRLAPLQRGTTPRTLLSRQFGIARFHERFAFTPRLFL